MRSAFAALRGPGDLASASSPGSMAADLTPDRMTAFVGMMEAVSVPPFERFYEELRRLTADLPEKERAAVFLRYGYDLSYEEIGDALGSSGEAARQATSSGVRRLRRKELS